MINKLVSLLAIGLYIAPSESATGKIAGELVREVGGLMPDPQFLKNFGHNKQVEAEKKIAQKQGQTHKVKVVDCSVPGKKKIHGSEGMLLHCPEQSNSYPMINNDNTLYYGMMDYWDSPDTNGWKGHPCYDSHQTVQPDGEYGYGVKDNCKMEVTQDMIDKLHSVCYWKKREKATTHWVSDAQHGYDVKCDSSAGQGYSGTNFWHSLETILNVTKPWGIGPGLDTELRFTCHCHQKTEAEILAEKKKLQIYCGPKACWSWTEEDPKPELTPEESIKQWRENLDLTPEVHGPPEEPEAAKKPEIKTKSAEEILADYNKCLSTGTAAELCKKMAEGTPSTTVKQHFTRVQVTYSDCIARGGGKKECADTFGKPEEKKEHITVGL